MMNYVVRTCIRKTTATGIILPTVSVLVGGFVLLFEDEEQQQCQQQRQLKQQQENHEEKFLKLYQYQLYQHFFNDNHKALCEAARSISADVDDDESCVMMKNARPPSWLRKNILSWVGIPLPIPRVLTSSDPALKLPKRFLKSRTKDEELLRRLLEEKAPGIRGDPMKAQALGQEIFEITYGKGVTPQQREDFLLRYGCTGWTTEIVETLVSLFIDQGIVEFGAGHGQWSRALAEAYGQHFETVQQGQQATSNNNDAPAIVQSKRNNKRNFDFVLAYDDMSNLPLNTHIYNPYTQPHHDYFGNVHELKTKEHTTKVLQSWHCRGRALLLVYPPPGSMAMDVVELYTNAAPTENDTIIYVGEGRGGANADEAFFDFLEAGDWILLRVMDVQKPPGDKGYEKLYVLQRNIQ